MKLCVQVLHKEEKSEPSKGICFSAPANNKAQKSDYFHTAAGGGIRGSNTRVKLKVVMNIEQRLVKVTQPPGWIMYTD
jgi:hypothetical protein